jgi:hypothetical protein
MAPGQTVVGVWALWRAAPPVFRPVVRIVVVSVIVVEIRHVERLKIGRNRVVKLTVGFAAVTSKGGEARTRTDWDDRRSNRDDTPAVPDDQNKEEHYDPKSDSNSIT